MSKCFRAAGEAGDAFTLLIWRSGTHRSTFCIFDDLRGESVGRLFSFVIADSGFAERFDDFDRVRDALRISSPRWRFYKWKKFKNNITVVYIVDFFP